METTGLHTNLGPMLRPLHLRLGDAVDPRLNSPLFLFEPDARLGFDGIGDAEVGQKPPFRRGRILLDVALAAVGAFVLLIAAIAAS